VQLDSLFLQAAEERFGNCIVPTVFPPTHTGHELVVLAPTIEVQSGSHPFCKTLHIRSMDRLARHVDDLRILVKGLTKRRVVVKFHKEVLTFNGDDTPMANLLLTMLGAVAEFERALILERQREGIAVAKTQGIYKGRQPSLTPARAIELRERATV
jgi:DNA invertase Pin-like site-specific DNA recombinase